MTDTEEEVGGQVKLVGVSIRAAEGEVGIATGPGFVLDRHTVRGVMNDREYFRFNHDTGLWVDEDLRVFTRIFIQPA
jgi:hypothetical protein